MCAEQTKNGVQRRKIWILGLDTVTVSGASNIRSVLESGQVGRVTDTSRSFADLPLWSRWFFPVTRFYGEGYGFFQPFRSQTEASYPPCRQFLDSKLGIKHFEHEDVIAACDALEEDTIDEQKLSNIYIQVINRRFHGGKDVPEDIIDAASVGLTEFSDSLLPWKRFHASKGVRKVYEYAKDSLEQSGDTDQLPSESVTDVANGIFAMEKTAPIALQAIAKDLDADVEKVFSGLGLAPTIPRMVTETGTLNGLLPEDDPAVAGKTVVLLDIKSAAQETGDVRWAFGVGTDERQCAAKGEILRFGREVQTELQRRRTAKSVIA